MKVQGSYSSLIRGVSQQAPADRLEGQHGEVINMLSDPVRGLVRRNGMIMDYKTISPFSADPSNGLADSFSFRTYSAALSGLSCDILYRSRERVGAVTDAHLDPIWIYDKLGRVFLPIVTSPGDTGLEVYFQGGFSAITNIGDIVLLAGNAVTPTSSVFFNWQGEFQYSCAAWVRGGGYSKTYTVRARRASDSSEFFVTYTTPQPSYQTAFDPNSVIPPEAVGTPYYQAFYNAALATYDTAANNWAAAATNASVPSAIANELAARLGAAGFFGWQVYGSTLVNDDVSFIQVTDGADGSLFRAVLQDVKESADLTDIHRVGKVVRVKPTTNTDDVYYLMAEARVAGDSNPWQEVIWREAPGETQRIINFLAMGKVVAGTFYLASSAGALGSLLPAENIPSIPDSRSGDQLVNPAPHFVGSTITMLTTFQDRLLVGSGSTINASEIGDYFNFFRTTIVTLPDSDPVEVRAGGADGDVIRKAAYYDRNLCIYGDRFHYAISGRVALTPSNAAMNVQFAMQAAADAQPVGTGKMLFLLKEDNQLACSRLLQVQTGVFQDTPDVSDASQQLRDYVNGTPAELVCMTTPDVVVIRTEYFLKSQGGFPRARPWGLYVYQYMDAPDGRRITDAWSSWEWSTALGTPFGISDYGTGDAFLLYTVGFGADESGAAARGVFVQKCSVRPDPTGLPYLDGLEVATEAELNGLWTDAAADNVQAVVFTSPGAAHSYSPVPATTDQARFVGLEDPNYTVGDGPAEAVDPFRWTGINGWNTEYVAAFPTAPTDNLWTGLAFPSFVDLTNPFLRDREGKANTLATINLTKLKVTTTRTAGIRASYRDHAAEKVVLDKGGSYSRIEYGHLVWVGRDTRHVQVRVAARDWYPITINRIEWQGNVFHYKARA